MIIHPIKYNRTINKQLRMKNRFASHRDRHPLGEEGTCHLEDASIRDTNDEKAADEFTTYHVVACGYHAANKKELMYGCSIIRSSTTPSLLFRRPRYVTILNSALTQQGPTQGELYRLMKMHLTFAIRIFCIWSTCTVPKARRYNRITADTGRTKQLVQIRLFAYFIYLAFAWPFKIIDPLSSIRFIIV